jgi:hypothetical protein
MYFNCREWKPQFQKLFFQFNVYIMFNVNVWFCTGTLHMVLCIAAQELLKVTTSCFTAIFKGVHDVNHLSRFSPSVCCGYQDVIDLVLLQHKHFLWCILVKENQIVQLRKTWRPDDWTHLLLNNLLRNGCSTDHTMGMKGGKGPSCWNNFPLWTRSTLSNKMESALSRESQYWICYYLWSS